MSAPTLPNVPSKAQIGLGAVISIGGASASPGTPEVWTVIGEVTDIKYSGETTSVAKYTLLSNLFTQKRAGSRDAGSVDLTIARVTNDAGQIALTAAKNDPTGQPYDYRVQLFANANDGQVTAGDTLTCSAVISKFNPVEDISPDKPVMMSVSLDLATPFAVVAGS